MSDKDNSKDRPRRMRDRNIESPKNFKDTLMRVINLFGKYKLILFFVIVLIISMAFLRAIGPYLIGWAIDQNLSVKAGIDLGGFTKAMILVTSVFVGAWLSNVIIELIMTKIKNTMIYNLRNRTVEHIQTLSMKFFDNRELGDIISRLTNDIEMIENFFANGMVSFVSSFFVIIGYLVMMIVTDVTLSLVVIFGVPVLAIITMIITKKVREAYRENQRMVGKLSANIQETVGAVRVIKTFNRENEEFNKFEKVNRDARDIGVKAETISFAFQPIMRTMTSILLALVIGFGGILAFNEMIQIGVIISFTIYVRRFIEPLRQITQVYNMMLSAFAGAERVFRIHDTKPDIKDKPDALVLKDVNGNVRFNDVKFGYEKDKCVLDGISLEAKKGEVIAIVGPTGAGKTTLVNLLSRFYDVDSGFISVDNVDIRDIKLNSLRRQMGIVLQESFFFAETIKENLLYGNPKADQKDMIEAAKLANADPFIRRLPKRYYTKLTERGMNLSQGERQLLAITRAIIADPKILILDEATSNVDSVTEAHIQKGLLELMKGRTSFIIAHRLSTIKRADKVIVIHNHKIIEEGTHDSLMEKGGFYSRLYKLQLKKDMTQLTEDMDI
jgi:ATP-binding cassette, subfamily B, multidrug efflux pump